MKLTKRELKEREILNAAEEVFSQYGYENTKMDDIAAKLGISKGLVYFYFNSKENLYMALTYRAMQTLNEQFYEVYHKNNHLPGYDTTVLLIEAYIEFLNTNPFYRELMINYTRLVRSSDQVNNQLTDSMKNSIYFRKIRDIHNIPITIAQEEISRGQKDGTIKNKRSPSLLYMTMWSFIMGFSQLKAAASQNNRMTMYHVNIREWQDYIMEIAKLTLQIEDYALSI